MEDQHKNEGFLCLSKHRAENTFKTKHESYDKTIKYSKINLIKNIQYLYEKI